METKLTRKQYFALSMLYNEYKEAFLTLPLSVQHEFTLILYGHYIPKD